MTNNPRVKIHTSEGEMIVELYPEAAPHTVDNFLQLCHDGFYDGLTFHRIVPGFVVQGGCPQGDGTGGAGWTIDAEFNEIPHDKGTVSMARTSEIHSASSQFFICLSRENCQQLDGEYTAFGRIVEGMDVLDRLAAAPLTSAATGKPADPPLIQQVYETYDETPCVPEAQSGDEESQTQM